MHLDKGRQAAVEGIPIADPDEARIDDEHRLTGIDEIVSD